MPRLVLLCVVAAYVVGGCASNRPTPPTPPVTPSSVYEQTWTFVPVRPPAPDTNARQKHRRMIEEVRKSLSAYDHSFTVYSTVDGGLAGVSSDTLYRPAQDDEEKRPLNEAVLQRIQERGGSRYLFLVRADRQDEPASKGIRPFVALDPQGALTIGVTTASDPAEQITSAALVNAKTAEVLWSGSRLVYGGGPLSRFEAPEVVGLNTRSLVVEALTGRTLKPSDFHVETPHSVLVYRYDETVIGTAARVEGRAVVVEKKDGPTARYPIHTVSKIKDTMQNQVIFPVPKAH